MVEGSPKMNFHQLQRLAQVKPAQFVKAIEEVKARVASDGVSLFSLGTAGGAAAVGGGSAAFNAVFNVQKKA
jgi:hypothetical protein